MLSWNGFWDRLLQMKVIILLIVIRRSGLATAKYLTPAKVKLARSRTHDNNVQNRDEKQCESQAVQNKGPDAVIVQIDFPIGNSARESLFSLVLEHEPQRCIQRFKRANQDFLLLGACTGIVQTQHGQKFRAHMAHLTRLAHRALGSMQNAKEKSRAAHGQKNERGKGEKDGGAGAPDGASK